MIIHKIIFSALIILFVSYSVHAENNLSTTQSNIQPADSPQSQIIHIQTVTQTRLWMDKLHFQMQELQSTLAQQPQNMTLIKTQTAWIRNILSSLHQWSQAQLKTENKDPVLYKLCQLIDDMEQEVKRDDMLDSIELQALFIHYIQAEHAFTEIERNAITE